MKLSKVDIWRENGRTWFFVTDKNSGKSYHAMKSYYDITTDDKFKETFLKDVECGKILPEKPYFGVVTLEV